MLRERTGAAQGGRPAVDFWDRVQKGDGDDCWLWTGSAKTTGRGKTTYGTFWFEGSVQSAHRVAWQLTHGPVPDGLCVLHSCDTPRCVRPDHLWLGTQLDNIADRERKGRGRGGPNAPHRIDPPS